MMFDWTSFLAGLLVGWLGEWVIDYLYFRRGGRDPEELEELKTKLNLAESRVNELEASLAGEKEESIRWQTDYAALMASVAAMETAKEDLSECRATNAALSEENAQLREELEQLRQGTGVTGTRAIVVDLASEPDDLTLIQGIGPRYAEKLNAAGILTYAALANAGEDDLNTAIQPEPWQKVDYGLWQDQARLFATLAPLTVEGDDLQQLEGIGPKYNRLLRDAGVNTYADLAESEPERLAAIIGAPPWRNVDYDAWIAQARLAAAGDQAGLDELQKILYSRSGDNLILIHGLGDSYNRALTDAGIYTYADLASRSPGEIEVIITAAGLRQADFESWIDEAKLRAAGKRIAHPKRSYKEAVVVSCPQDLEPIDGVGIVYERRLYNAGIGSFWEVAQIKEEELAEILEVEEFQDVDLTAIRSSALALARETNSMNRVWDGTPPDDFEPLEGIGVIYERRLYAAGYCTFEALAGADPEELERICHPPNFNKPDFAKWIATAKSLVAAREA
jgi:predicted flap endonuclease-1-like 5' DNA nuclease